MKYRNPEMDYIKVDDPDFWNNDTFKLLRKKIKVVMGTTELSIKKGEHLIGLGQTGSGKTAWGYSFVKNLPPSMTVVVFNSMDLDGWRSICDDEIKAMGRLDKTETGKLVGVEIPELLEYFLKPRKERPAKICITPELIKVCAQGLVKDVGAYISLYWDTVCKYAFLEGNCMVIVDELALVVPSSMDLTTWHEIILRQGRNRLVTHIAFSQRFQDVSKIVTDMSTHKVLFKMDTRAVSSLKDKVAFIQKALRLRPYHWVWVFRDESYRVMAPVPLEYDDMKQGKKQVPSLMDMVIR